MAADRDPPRVLVVDDEREVADVFAEHLKSTYAVQTAYSGAEAVAALDDEPDAVLLDRRMPEMHGEAVLEAIQERDVDPRVAMVTAVQPDFDIIDVPFDEYVVKPVDRAELVRIVRGLIDADDVEAKKRELSQKRVTRNVLEVEKRPRELAENERFQRLEERIERLETEIAAIESE